MNKDKKEIEYPVELESQIIMRLPEEPAKQLREALRTGDGLKNRLTIQFEEDMRQGEVRFDQWIMHAKIVDLPTIIESLKTIDNKSFYKTADICQMMICKEEPDQPVEEDTPVKNKKKDSKVDKKYLWPHGITPPTKNVRKRRFRKTLKKKFVEAPEVEKEVKRLLRADNEALEITWEVVKEEDDRKPQPGSSTHSKHDKKSKSVQSQKHHPAKIVDIFGGAVSDSDLEDENINVELEDCHLSSYDSRLSDTESILGGSSDHKLKERSPTEYTSKMFQTFGKHTPRTSTSQSRSATPATPGTSGMTSKGLPSSDDDYDYQRYERPKEDMTARIEQLRLELQEMKQRRVQTQNEIAGMENMALRQRFQETLHVLNQDIMYKEMEYQGMLTLQNSDDI